MPDDVLNVGDIDEQTLCDLLLRFGLTLSVARDDRPIPGSYWGEREAGVIGTTVYARPDTPVHSLLHETCHVICMDGPRRAALHQDAGGDDLEEAAVCYLQLVLADEILGVGRERLMADMDAWGYSFRLGSTLAWFENDAEDALDWLIRYGLVFRDGKPAFQLRP